MKTILNNLLKTIAILLILGIAHTGIAQDSPPPPPGGSTGQSDGTGGADGDRNGAPIGGGLFILLALGAAYGGKKIYDMRKEKLEE